MVLSTFKFIILLDIRSIKTVNFEVLKSHFMVIKTKQRLHGWFNAKAAGFL